MAGDRKVSVKRIIAVLIVVLLIGITGRWQAQNDEPVVLQLKMGT